MLFPTKHIRLSESLLGLSGFIIKYLNEPITIDQVWKNIKEDTKINIYPYSHSLSNLVLALDFLYLLGAIDIDQEGKISYEVN